MLRKSIYILILFFVLAVMSIVGSYMIRLHALEMTNAEFERIKKGTAVSGVIWKNEQVDSIKIGSYDDGLRTVKYRIALSADGESENYFIDSYHFKQEFLVKLYGVIFIVGIVATIFILVAVKGEAVKV